MRQVSGRASGGWSTPARWQIRQGNMITLAELFSFGAYRCTCWDLYRTYRSLEVFMDPKPRACLVAQSGVPFLRTALKAGLRPTVCAC